MKIRIKLWWAVFGKLRKYIALSHNTLMHATESWTNVEKLLKITQSQIEKPILGIRLILKKNIWRYNKTRLGDAAELLAKLKWSWVRYGDERWNLKTMIWRPRTGNRNRARLRPRWRDDIQKPVDSHAVRKVKYRLKWRRLGEVYIQSCCRDRLTSYTFNLGLWNNSGCLYTLPKG